MNKLKFLGNNGSFSLGNNNAAYYILNDILIIFDCGETVFKEIKKRDLICDRIKRIDIIITHFHSDHVGSLGSLVFYCRYRKIKDVNVIFPIKEMVHNLLNLYGISDEFYQVLKPSEVADYYLKEYKVQHGDIINNELVLMPAYGYHFQDSLNNFFFSGDCANINKQVLKLFDEDKINILYHDVSEDGYKTHVQLEELERLISKEDRRRVFLMHLNDNVDIKKITDMGFQIARDNE